LNWHASERSYFRQRSTPKKATSLNTTQQHSKVLKEFSLCCNKKHHAHTKQEISHTIFNRKSPLNDIYEQNDTTKF